jgi:beta-lactamase class A
MLTLLSACADHDVVPITPVTPSPEARAAAANGAFHALETQYDADLGVYAVDTASGRTVEYHADDRVAFCSTFKALAAAEVLRLTTPADLDERVTYSTADLMPNSLIAEQHLEGGMSMREILDAAVRDSDNTAANILLQRLGGPKGFEQRLREIGDTVSSADRFEIALSEAKPGDERDTTTPRAIAGDLREYVLGDVLLPEDRIQLIDLLIRNKTGDKTIRSGVPSQWLVGDKTGSGGYGTRNDIAVLWPPNRAPIVLAVMSKRRQKDANYEDALIAQSAGVVVETLI